MTAFKLILACMLSLSMSACFHIQLGGSVAGATLTIAPLDDPGNVVVSGVVSYDAQAWKDVVSDESWDSFAAFSQLLLLGVATPPTDALNPQTMYLVTVSGGHDFDPDSALALSDTPQSVQGSWHTIAIGQRIIAGNLKVSALTEALYLQLEDRLAEYSDAAIMLRLNAAAQLVVTDITGDGLVDYNDVLVWNRSLAGAPQYQGDIAAVDALAAAIRAGQPVADLSTLAREVLGNHEVVMEFDAGTITLETLNWDAPITAANFLSYVRDGFYNQMLVHRAINNFMIQMGLVAYLGIENGQINWEVKSPNPSIVNEASHGLSNVRGTLSMARVDGQPDSGNAQFFINQVNNTFLDFGSDRTPDGHAVFARVLSGMDVVDSIAAEPGVTVSGIGQNVPARGVLLNSVALVQ